MKHFFPIALAAMTVLPAAAEQLTPDESLARFAAMQNGPSRARAFANCQLNLVYTEKEGDDNTLYVFNRPDGEGFIILGADDLAPEMLGFSENGAFDESKVAPHFLAWLKDYSGTIGRAIVTNKSAASKARRANRAAIAPILKSKWGQKTYSDGLEVYNKYCPVVDDQRCPTGCLATAVAQVMYNFKYPTKGTGSHSYTSATHNLSLSSDFANTYYDWDHMQDTYGSYHDENGNTQNTSVSSTANNAVSRLMYDCGVSMDMDYAPNGSGAYTYNALTGLVENFGYNPGMSYRIRYYYSDEAWEFMIYSELAKGVPVVYCGATTNNEGHAFVCDGYKDGLYHINWGWGGVSDGYYTILGNNALHPIDQGVGGSFTCDAFSQGHEIIYGFVPPAQVTSPTHAFVMEGGYSVVDEETEEPKLQNGSYAKVTMPNGAFNLTYGVHSFEFGLKLENEELGLNYDLPALMDEPIELPFLSGFRTLEYYVECAGVEDGVYSAIPVCRIAGETEWTPIASSQVPGKIAYGDAEIPDPEQPDGPEKEELWLVCSGVSSTSDYDYLRTAHIRIECPGNADDKAFDGYIAPVIYDNELNFVAVCDDIKQEFKQEASSFDRQKTFDFDVLIPEESGDQRYIISVAGISKKNLESGTWSLFYTLDLSYNEISEYNPATEVWANGAIVTDKETPTGGWLDDASLVCSDVKSPVNYDSNRKLHVHINNPGNIGNDFSGWIAPCIFDENENGIALFPELAQSFEMASMKYSRDISFDFVVDLPEELSDGTYLASVFGLQKYSRNWTKFSTIEVGDEEANIVNNAPYFEFMVSGNNVTTGNLVNILAPLTETPSDRLSIYDIYGRRVNCSGNSLNGLNNIVISNGRKLLKR